MTFGDPTDFAIEAFHQPTVAMGAGFGRMCIHIQGVRLGDIREDDCSLFHATDQFRDLYPDIERLWDESFAGLSDAQIFAVLDHALFVGEESQWERYGRFQFLTNTGEQFDDAKTFIVRRPNGHVHILYYRFRDSTFGSGVCTARTFCSVAESYVRWFDEQIVNSPVRAQRVYLEPHDPRWAEEFTSESSLVASAIGNPVVAIHHIGSTAIPGIRAKPVIDMLAIVSDVSLLDERSPQLEALGYEVMGEFGISGRRYFRKDNDAGIRTHQIHAFQAGSPQIQRHLLFRDFMRAHPDCAQKYEALKHWLAERYPNDIASYAAGKDEFIRVMDARALQWRSESVGVI